MKRDWKTRVLVQSLTEGETYHAKTDGCPIGSDLRRCAGAGAKDFPPTILPAAPFERRAVEAVIWGMPAVNYDLMFQAMVGRPRASSTRSSTGRGCSDWKNQTLTPNPDAIYFMPFFNTKDVGPMVLEIPPADEAARSPAASRTAGRPRWRTSAPPASTRARAAST